jgi:hypothetical protein
MRMGAGTLVRSAGLRELSPDDQAFPTKAVEPSGRQVARALGACLLLVLITRWPVARPLPLDGDETGYLESIRQFALPPMHTLFLAAGHLAGNLVGNAYRGFQVLDMLVSALTLTASWWWLRALVRPATAAAGTLLLAVSPIFWAYGAMAANYPAIAAVGAFLLGIAWRGRNAPRIWHPFAAAAVLALGAGYRQDIGTCWLPVFAWILWPHRRTAALPALAVFTLLNLAWLLPMLANVGGWQAYRDLNRAFAYRAGYLNSFWNQGWIDGPIRYAVKAAVALALTFGVALMAVPRGLWRLRGIHGGRFLSGLLLLSVLPALGLHLFVHFGVAGYAFHYVPALLALVTLGIGRVENAACDIQAWPRLAVVAGSLALFFLAYPADFHRVGVRRDFDLVYGRFTRTGLFEPVPVAAPSSWRTVNSVDLPGSRPRLRRRESITEIFGSFVSGQPES